MHHALSGMQRRARRIRLAFHRVGVLHVAGELLFPMRRRFLGDVWKLIQSASVAGRGKFGIAARFQLRERHDVRRLVGVMSRFRRCKQDAGVRGFVTASEP